MRFASRERLGLGISESTSVAGAVGSFEERKNPMGIIRIFEQYHKSHPDSVLLWIGDGEMRELIQEEICSLGLEDAIKLLGVCSDVADLM